MPASCVLVQVRKKQTDVDYVVMSRPTNLAKCSLGGFKLGLQRVKLECFRDAIQSLVVSIQNDPERPIAAAY